MLKYLSPYSTELQNQIQHLIDTQQLGHYLQRKYPAAHTIHTDKALYQYTTQLKKQFLKLAPQIDKVMFDKKLDVVGYALGTHTAVSRAQGAKLVAAREIRVAALFKSAPAAFLDMIVVHELAHLKEREHNKAFYQLCTHMLPDYHQLEFDTRVYLTYLDVQHGA